MEKLRPETDLNDVIIGSYIKLLQFVFLPLQTDQSTYIFSSFFLEKIIGELVKDEVIYDKDSLWLVEQVRTKVKESYKNVKRWTKKIDIFEKEMLVYPINAFKHWFCILVLRPNSLISNSGTCEVVYCDSMFERRDFVAEAIRKYLQHEL
jgi:sentrin-specific protease 7